MQDFTLLLQLNSTVFLQFCTLYIDFFMLETFKICFKWAHYVRLNTKHFAIFSGQRLFSSVLSTAFVFHYFMQYDWESLKINILLITFRDKSCTGVNTKASVTQTTMSPVSFLNFNLVRKMQTGDEKRVKVTCFYLKRGNLILDIMCCMSRETCNILILQGLEKRIIFWFSKPGETWYSAGEFQLLS